MVKGLASRHTQTRYRRTNIHNNSLTLKSNSIYSQALEAAQDIVMQAQLRQLIISSPTFLLHLEQGPHSVLTHNTLSNSWSSI